MSSGSLSMALGHMMVGFKGATLPEYVADWLHDGLAGIFLFPPNGNFVDAQQVRRLTDAIHEANPGCLVAIDQEGGRVQAWGPPHVVAMPTARELGAMAAAEVRAVGLEIGRQLRAIGVDLNFAPVLDVDTCPDNPIIGDRSFAAQPAAVTASAQAFVAGQAQAGVLACGKHFPGHGDTERDSHLTLPVVERSIAVLRAVELAPFVAMLDDLPMLMTAHVVHTALDPQHPATHSRAVLTGLLREQMGYRGVLISDDLAMEGIRTTHDLPGAAVAALAAGCDLVLSAFEDAQHPAMLAAIAAALADGALSVDWQRTSSARIERLLAMRKGRVVSDNGALE